MKAILRSWVLDIRYTDEVIEIDDRYDFGKGPYHPDNEDFCPVVGSNQEILHIRKNAIWNSDQACEHPSGFVYRGAIPCTGPKVCHMCGAFEEEQKHGNRTQPASSR